MVQIAILLVVMTIVNRNLVTRVIGATGMPELKFLVHLCSVGPAVVPWICKYNDIFLDYIWLQALQAAFGIKELW